MLVAGDEVERTQGGNNNAWCQDTPVSWFDWSLVETNADLLRFVREIIRFRLGNPTLRRRTFLRGAGDAGGAMPDVEWFSADGGPADWGAVGASLTCFFAAAGDPSSPRVTPDPVAGIPRHVLILLHAGSEPRSFRLPQAPHVAALPWRLFLDTREPSPFDVHGGARGPLMEPGATLDLPPHALVCFVADPLAAGPPSIGSPSGEAVFSS
jgi:glycogen operon protein